MDHDWKKIERATHVAPHGDIDRMRCAICNGRGLRFESTGEIMPMAAPGSGCKGPRPRPSKKERPAESPFQMGSPFREGDA